MDTKCRCSERDSSTSFEKGQNYIGFTNPPSSRRGSFFSRVWYKRVQICFEYYDKAKVSPILQIRPLSQTHSRL